MMIEYCNGQDGIQDKPNVSLREIADTPRQASAPPARDRIDVWWNLAHRSLAKPKPGPTTQIVLDINDDLIDAPPAKARAPRRAGFLLLNYEG